MNLRTEWKWVVLIALVCVIVFANSLSGEFVYDDLRQILRNPLIQDNSLIGKALTSDVWAFKGDGTTVASNYWRPTFTAWLILNFRLFGANPFGWHLLNLLLHAGVCVLAFLLLRRWSFTVFVALAITLIFAVHPVHVESVSWISGSPDLLFSLAFLGSLWFAQNYAEKRDTQNLIIALILYAIALGAKEIGILCLPVYYLIFMKVGENKQKSKSLDAQLLFFGGVAVIYFFARVSIIGAVSIPPDDATSFGSAILSIPSIFAFYLRQTIFPFWLGANYPLLPVSQISLTNFVVPLLISIGAIVGIFYLAKDSKIGKIGAALLILLLIPAMNATAFISEQIVHDRYWVF